MSLGAVEESVHVDVCNDEAGRAAAGVLEYAIDVLSNAQSRCPQTVKYGEDLFDLRRLQLRLVSLNGFLEDGGEKRQNPGNFRDSFARLFKPQIKVDI